MKITYCLHDGYTAFNEITVDIRGLEILDLNSLQTYSRIFAQEYELIEQPLKRLNLVQSWGFFSLKISLFGCNVAHAFSRACSFDLMFVHIWA